MQKSGSLGISIPLPDVRRLRTCGVKAVTAARLARLGFVVPDGFCIPVDAYKAHLWATGVRSLARNLSRQPDYETLHDSVLRGEMPSEVARSIEAAYLSLGEDVVVAVRHSASDEAVIGRAYLTVLGVRGLPALLEAVKQVWASLWTEEAVNLRAATGARTEPVMAVLVQVMVDPIASGTVESANPETGNPNEAVIRSTLGIYGGAVECDEFIVGLEDFSIISSRGAENPSVSDSETVELAETVLWVERSLGSRCLLQWANDGKGFAIIGARPLDRLPRYFPVDDLPGVWRLVDPKPVSPFARSISSAYATVNGRLYRRADSVEASYSRSGPQKRLEQARASARRMLDGISSRSTDGIVAEIRRGSEHVELTSKWMVLAEDIRDGIVSRLREELALASADPALAANVVAGLGRAEMELDIALQRLSAYTWQAGMDYESALIPDELAAEAAADFGFAFRNALDAVDPAAWTSWVEDPDPVSRLGYALARGPVNDIELGAAALSSATSAAESEAADSIVARGGKRAASHFVRLFGQARKWSETVSSSRRAHAIVMSALRANAAELGRRLEESGVLSSAEDIFCLTLDEIGSFEGKPASEKLDRFRQRVIHRKHEMWLESRLDAPRYLGQEVPDDPLPPPTARKLSGRPVSAGEVEGHARVVSTFDEGLKLQPGEILVAEQFGPAWTPLLALASGLVLAADPLRVSTAAAAYGIPCVIVHGAISILKSGQLVRIDGAAGNVEIVKRNENGGTNPYR